jgi:hypothetical protein
LPGQPNPVEVLGVYGREKVLEAVEAALADYREAFVPAAGEPTATR